MWRLLFSSSLDLCGLFSLALLFGLLTSHHSAWAADPKLPPLGTDVPTGFERGDTELEYGWKASPPLIYKFFINVELGSSKREYRGRNTLKLSDKSVQLAEIKPSEQQGSASGFIVHPEGIIVTCAHAVHGATSVTARIDGQDVEAKVIGADFDKDIAVLRVNRKNLSHMVFANSDAIRLADEVRAIGYPLTDILGESIKVTRGEISGIGGLRGKDGLQFDAPINPGNSGGPVIDSSGRVVGVSNALLSGAGISEVSFAIPANQVVEFVKSLNVPVAVSQQTNSVSAADMVATATPACVLIKAKIGTNGIGTEQLNQLDGHAYWYNATVPKLGQPYRPPSHNSAIGKLVVNQTGEVLLEEAESSLPCLLGNAATVGIEKLAQTAPGNTSSRSLLVFQSVEQDQLSPYGLRPSYRSRLGLPLTPGLERSRTVKLMAGVESTSYTFGTPQGNQIPVSKDLELRIDDEKSDEPYLQMAGTGKGVFDRERGAMSSMEFQAKLTISRENITVKIPVSMKYELLSAEELAAEEARRKKAAAEREKRNAERLAQKAEESRLAGFKSDDTVATPGDTATNSVKDMRASTKLDLFDPQK